MSKTKFVVGDRVKFVKNCDTLIATAIPSIGAVGVIKTVCDILPWYSIEWDIIFIWSLERKTPIL